MSYKHKHFFSLDENVDFLLESLIDNIGGTIMVVDSSGKVLLIGDSFHWGNDQFRLEDALGQHVDQLIRAGLYDKSIASECIRQRKKTDGIVNNSSGRPAFSTAYPVFGEDGEVAYVIIHVIHHSTMQKYMSGLEELRRKQEQYKHITEYLDQHRSEGLEPIAVSSAMRQVFFDCRQIAPSDSCVLLTGESGTGKEVCANFIHQHSNRREQPFLPINCSAFPPELIDAELFGYEKGAFTGANSRGHIGLLETAEQGTVFLDEIGDLPLGAQAKLLRFLETGEIRRVGGSKIIRLDVRIISATNRNLAKMVRTGQFREDLYHRLNVLPIRLPPLRDRPEDILPLAYLFLHKYTQKHKKDFSFSPETEKKLFTYSYPGNVRELRNLVERMVLTSSDPVLDISPTESAPAEMPAAAEAIGTEPIVPLRDAVHTFKKAYIENAIRRCGGNVTKAAAQLQVHRTLLYKTQRSFE